MSFMVLLMVLTIPVEVFAQEKTNVKGTIKQETRENKDISSRQKRSLSSKLKEQKTYDDDGYGGGCNGPVNTFTGRVGSLSTKGQANSTSELYDNSGSLLQRRFYDSEGKAMRDIDYSHGDSHNNHTFPHEHTWTWRNGSPGRD